MRLARRWPLLHAGQIVLSVILAVALFSGAGWALSDVTLYYQWTGQILEGEVPYRDFFFDYPPLSLPALMAPRVLSAFGDVTYGTYLVLFAASMVGLSIALFQVVRGIVRRLMSIPAADHALKRHLLLMALSLPVLLIRYDLWPILLVALAFLSTLDRRPVLAGAWLGIGIAAKLYPLILVPVFVAYWLFSHGWRTALQHVTSVLVVTIGVLLPFLLLSEGAIGDMLQFQQQRGLQVETAAGGVIQLLGLLAPEDLAVVHTGTYELVSDRVSAYQAIQPIIAVAALGLATVFGAYRVRDAVVGGRGPLALASVATAVLIVFVLTNRALSPQHVFWCLSFAALLPGYRYVALLGIIGLTLAIFPLLYEQLLAQEVLPILVLNLRNGLFAILAVALLTRPIGPAASEP